MFKNNFDVEKSFLKYKQQVNGYLRDSVEVPAHRVYKTPTKIILSLMLKVEYYVLFKMTEEIDFYVPLYRDFERLFKYTGYDLKINIYCSKK